MKPPAAPSPPPWRHALLAGLVAGLGIAPMLGSSPGLAPAAALLGAVAAAALAMVRRAGRGGGAAWLLAVALAAALAGLGIGSARLDAIDSGALRAPAGFAVALEGEIASPPRSGPDGMTAELETRHGRVQLAAPDLDGLSVGESVAARGRLADPPPWLASRLRGRGIAAILSAERVVPTGERRGGLAGAVDAIRERAEVALGRGMPEREAALARGFVLGQDDGIDAATREDFRRSGLSHLLAVSGQNVILLCLLAWPLLALLGLTLRARLIALLALIAIYVPLTGAGPSIQRAATMGAAGVFAALVDRPRSRWYALLAAAAATLAVNPRAESDIGWQLSFAAVIGIFLWSGRLAALIGGGATRGTPRRALAEGVALTVAATVATAPLSAHHFGSLPVGALAANVLALPAVAPAMWLGMLAGLAGQLPAIPVEPLNWLDSLCLAYIAEIARRLGSPEWALLEVDLATPALTAAAYAGLAALAELGLAVAARLRGSPPAAHDPAAGTKAEAPGRGGIRSLRAPALIAVLAALALVFAAGGEGGGSPRGSADALSVRVLDVGQGDAILLDPPGGPPVLVDAGPPGSGAAHRLRELGISRLGALVVTHDQSDHAGAAAEVLDAVAVERLVLGARSERLAALAAAAGAEPVQLAEGGEIDSGELRLTVLWPPRTLLGASIGDPNALSLVLLAEWRHFSVLLTGDAEAEAAHLDPGPVDAIKLAHHGSADDGLEALLESSAPKLALVSVGENPYGHPAPETLAELGEHGVPVARTDEQGELVIEADASGWRTGDG